MLPLSWLLGLSAALFCIGLFGVLSRTAEAGSREILLIAAQDEIAAPSRVFRPEPV